MVTSINGNNVTWRDNKTGELVTDPHNDLEIMMKRGGKVARKRKQRGGREYRPRGLVQRGSGRIDPTSKHRLPVDDVRALIGRGEYVFNANAVKELGEPFLDNLNAIGLGNSTLPRGTGNYGGYQRGGRVNNRRNNMRRGGKVRRQRGGRGRVRRQQGGMRTAGRAHSHSYSPKVQQHWGTYPGGTTNAPSGYTHNHGRTSHNHPFSNRTQTHWGRYPGGRGRGTMGYSHTHNGNSQMRRGGRVRRQQGGPGSNLPTPWGNVS